MDETILGYAAGFFDGEGCILTRERRGHVELRVTAVQNAAAPLLLLKEHFGGAVIHIVPRDIYVWEISHRKAREFLAAVLPHLMVKRERAERALALLPGERLSGVRETRS